MITGHNTDVQYNGTVFHVQTEDKGTSNPFIETLVYVGGQVLAAKRQSYAELLAEGKGEKEIIAQMEKQHRAMIGTIRAGKFDEKLQALRGTKGVPAAAPTGELAVAVAGAEVPGSSEFRPPPDELPVDSSRTLDQVILDYLTSEADQEQLLLMVDGDDSLTPGRRAGLAVHASSSKSGLAVAEAEISVKMISTSREPCTLASGQTGSDGSLALAFDIPALDGGAAALIIVADSTIGTAEIKHLL